MFCGLPFALRAIRACGFHTLVLVNVRVVVRAQWHSVLVKFRFELEADGLT